MTTFLRQVKEFGSNVVIAVVLYLVSLVGSVLRMIRKKTVDNGEVRCVSTLCLGPTVARHIIRKSCQHWSKLWALNFCPSQWLTYGCSLVGDQLQWEEDCSILILMASVDRWDRLAALMLQATGQQNQGMIQAPVENEFLGLTINPKFATVDLDQALAHLEKGSVLIFPVDQVVKREPYVNGQLLGHEASFLDLSKLENIRPVKVYVASFCHHHQKTEIHLSFFGDGTVLNQHNAHRLYQWLDSEIRKNAEYWFWWTFPRWGEPEPEEWLNDLVH